MIFKRFTQFALFISLLFIFSCGTEEEIQDALTISSNTESVFLGNEISFSANSQVNGNVTSNATFFVNGNQIEGNVFTPSVANEENQVYATYNGLTSNTITFVSRDENVDVLTITADAEQVAVGNEITFTAMSQNTGEVTQNATFFVNGNEIEGNVFVPNTVNEANQVYATWTDYTSNTLTFASVENQPTVYTQKVLVEDYTGTWCGYCPGMNNVLNHFTAYNANVIPVAIHCDDDPYQFEFQQQLQAEYGTIGLPKAQINRINSLELYVENFIIDYCGTNETYYQELIQPYLDETAPLGLAINSSLNGNSLNFEVQIGFLVNEISNAKLVVYLLEDDLLHEQTNYFAGDGSSDCPYSSQPQHIEDFEHNHVLRKAYTDIFGDTIPANEIAENNIYTRNFEVSLPAEIESTEHLSLVAFVMGNANNEVINAQYVHVGEEQDFD